MRHSSIFALLAVIVVLAIGCIEESCVTGSGSVISESRTIERFRSINFNVPGDLYLTQGPYQPLRIEAEDNILQLLNTYVTNGKLTVDLEQCINPRKTINIRVSMEDVEGLEVSGSGNIIIESEIDADDIELVLSGSGRIIGENLIDADAIDAEITGSGYMDLLVDCEDLSTAIEGSGNLKLGGMATNHKASIDGSGKIESYGLSTDISQITITGSGSGEVSVFEELDVKISGSGNVRYKGNPEKIRSDIFGSGRLRKVD